MEDWVTKTGMPEDFSLAVSESGYSNDYLCLEWLKHFKHHRSKRQAGEYRMLIIDGYRSHCTLEFIDFCERHKIIPFCLPPHTTHFSSLSTLFFSAPMRKSIAISFMRPSMYSCCANFNKIEFLHALKTIRQRAFRDTSISSGFRKAGIYPFNPEIVLKKLSSDNTSSSETAPLEPLALSEPTPQLSSTEPITPRPTTPERLTPEPPDSRAFNAKAPET
jgi:hypothetical protein